LITDSTACSRSTGPSFDQPNGYEPLPPLARFAARPAARRSEMIAFSYSVGTAAVG
jgi:hypothetical protein